MSLRPGDIVELQEDYNNWSKKGCVGVVEEIEVTSSSGTLVSWYQPLAKHSRTVCWDYRLKKVGEVEHAS